MKRCQKSHVSVPFNVCLTDKNYFCRNHRLLYAQGEAVRQVQSELSLVEQGVH
jgi:hypothetical protein